MDSDAKPTDVEALMAEAFERPSTFFVFEHEVGPISHSGPPHINDGARSDGLDCLVNLSEKLSVEDCPPRRCTGLDHLQRMSRQPQRLHNPCRPDRLRRDQNNRRPWLLGPLQIGTYALGEPLGNVHGPGGDGSVERGSNQSPRL